MRLAIELYGAVIGTLEGDPRGLDFTPSIEGIERFGPNSTILSAAIPLAPNPRRDHSKRRRNWFAELLPEGDQYDYMLAQAGLTRGDTPAFLARYGLDVAGALQIWDRDDPTEPPVPGTKELTAKQVRVLLEDPIATPLANAPEAGKSSLGGVQPKIVLFRSKTGWAQALGGHPSTHILKPQLGGNRASVIFDEEYGSRLARRVGLSTFEVFIEVFDGLPTLVIERFDRVGGERVHQEDFSQVLGASRNEKYQEFGGVVSLKRVAESLVKNAPVPDLARLARMVVFSVAIGNLDLHAKNLGLLHPRDGDLTLAPAYDVVPQTHQPNDGKLAMAINGHYRHSEIIMDDLQAEFASWGFRNPTELITETLQQLEAAAGSETPLDGAAPGLQRQVLGFTRRLLAGESAGGPVGGSPS